MRELRTKDIFAMSRIVTELDIINELKPLAERIKNGEEIDQSSAGFAMIDVIMRKASTKKCEQMLYEFVGDVLEKKAEEVANGNFFELLDELKGAADWRAFFVSVVRIVTRSY